MNLPSTIEVVITPRDVLTTNDYWCDDCALGKAIKRATKQTASIGAKRVWFAPEGRRIAFKIKEGFLYEEFLDLRTRAENGERFKIKKTLTRQV